jgi:hypothetical protein
MSALQCMRQQPLGGATACLPHHTSYAEPTALNSLPSISLHLTSILVSYAAILSMPATSDETLCEACQDLFGEERYKEAYGGIYEHHVAPDAFRQALYLPCSLCIRIWIYFQRRRYGKFEGFEKSNWKEFDRLTPITYELPRILTWRGEPDAYCLLFSLSDLESVCLHLEPRHGKISASTCFQHQLSSFLKHNHSHTHTLQQQARATTRHCGFFSTNINTASEITSHVEVTFLILNFIRQG